MPQIMTWQYFIASYDPILLPPNAHNTILLFTRRERKLKDQVCVFLTAKSIWELGLGPKKKKIENHGAAVYRDAEWAKDLQVQVLQGGLCVPRRRRFQGVSGPLWQSLSLQECVSHPIQPSFPVPLRGSRFGSNWITWITLLIFVEA